MKNLKPLTSFFLIVGAILSSGCQAYYPDPNELNSNRELEDVNNTESFNFGQDLGNPADVTVE